MVTGSEGQSLQVSELGGRNAQKAGVLIQDGTSRCFVSVEGIYIDVIVNGGTLCKDGMYNRSL